MRPHTPPHTIGPSIHRITTIILLIETQLPLFLTRPSNKATTSLLSHADAQTIARRAAPRRVRVVNASVALVAKVIVGATATADLVRVGWEDGRWRGFGGLGLGRLGSGRGLWREFWRGLGRGLYFRGEGLG